MKDQKPRIRPWMVGTAALVAIAGIAWAASPFRADAGVQMKAQSSNPISGSAYGIYPRTSDGHLIYSNLGATSDISAGGGGASFPLTGVVNSITTAQTFGLSLQDTTAATSGVPQQFSPGLELSGTAWDTGATASKTDKMMWQLEPQSANPTTNRLSLWTSIGGASYARALRIDTSDGTNVTITAPTVTAGTMSLFDGNTSGVQTTGGNTTFWVNNVCRTYIDANGSLRPCQGTEAVGGSGTQWTAMWSNVYATVLGTAIASASTISPVRGITHITGTTAINTINVPVTSFVGCIVLIPDGAFTTGTSGNIALASTAVVNKALTECFDGTKWYPSY